MQISLFLTVCLMFSYLELARATNSVNHTTFLSSFDYSPVRRPNGLHACFNKSKASLKNPGILNITVALGYSDLTDEHLDFVTDVNTLNSLNYNLTNFCTYEGQGFCEFKLVAGNRHQVNHYTRDLLITDGQNLTVNIYTINSSYSGSNYDNKTKYKDLQEEQTKTAQDLLAWSLNNADIVFYEGHSRDGGGPDFSPPRPNRSGSVNYSWYHANKPGLKFLLAALDAAEGKPMTLGLFSCASRRHFLRSIQQHTPGSKFILSTKVVEAGKTKKALMLSLESVLNFECDADLKARLSGTSFIVN